MLAPYQSRPYESQGTSRMSDLIMRRGELQARAALQRGQIAAEGARELGGIVSGTMSDLARQKINNTEKAKAEARQKLADERTRTIQGREDVLWNQRQTDAAKQGKESMAMTSAIKQDDQGHWVYDRDLLAKTLKDAGIGDRLPSLLKTIDDIESSTMQQRVAKMKLDEVTKETIGKSAYAISQADRSGLGKAAAFKAEAERLVKNGVVTEQDVAPYLQRLNAAPGDIDVVLGELMKGAGIQPDKPTVHKRGDILRWSNGRTETIGTPDPTVFHEGDVIDYGNGKREKIPKTKAPGSGSDRPVTTYQRTQLEQGAKDTKRDRLKKAEEDAEKARQEALKLTKQRDPLDPEKTALSYPDYLAKKKEINDRLEQEKARIYRDFDDDMRAVPQGDGEEAAPARTNAGASSNMVTYTAPDGSSKTVRFGTPALANEFKRRLGIK